MYTYVLLYMSENLSFLQKEMENMMSKSAKGRKKKPPTSAASN